MPYRLRPSYSQIRYKLLTLVVLLLGLFVRCEPVQAAVTSDVRTKFFGVNGVSLLSLSSGGYGTGFILYYLRERGVQHPSLVVKLEKDKGDAKATAYIYDTPPNRHDVPISFTPHLEVDVSLHPAIVMTASRGWWVHRGMTNYNLQTEIYEPLYAMWGEEGYRNLISSGNEPIFRIITNADNEGIPLWDFRTLIPQLSDHSVIRSNYAQRMGSRTTGLTHVPSLSPLWPYVAKNGAFEQPSGQLVPPIVVDWNNGRISAFSELVTVRNQGNSYDFYSLTPLVVGKINSPDFESPWALYDLSGQGKSYPNLVIRNEHYYSSDPWSIGLDPLFIDAPLFDKPSEVIRYSWADHPGDQTFDYKVDVFGFHPYPKSPVPIAGGLLRVTAPSYNEYPSWVIGQQWPVTTFVDANGGSYRTSEGIYDWSSGDIGPWYWRGWTDAPDLTQFNSITEGLRGEYRIGDNKKPILYMSPIDKKLHLTYAQGGLWNVGNEFSIQEQNLTQGKYIDSWKLIRNNKTISQLTYLAPYLIEGDSSGLRVKLTKVPQEAFTLMPPTNHRSWVTFSQIVAKYSRKYPPNLAIWFQKISGSAETLHGVKLIDVRRESEGFDLVVKLPARHSRMTQFEGVSVPWVAGLYILHWDNRTSLWSIRAATSAKMRASADVDVSSSTVRLFLRNTGDAPWMGTISLRIGAHMTTLKDLVIQGHSVSSYNAVVYPSELATLPVLARSGSETLLNKDFQMGSFLRPSMLTMLKLSSQSLGMILIETFALCLLLGLCTFYILLSGGKVSAGNEAEVDFGISCNFGGNVTQE